MKRWCTFYLLLLGLSAFGYVPQPKLYAPHDRANRLTNAITPLLRWTKQTYNDRGLLR